MNISHGMMLYVHFSSENFLFFSYRYRSRREFWISLQFILILKLEEYTVILTAKWAKTVHSIKSYECLKLECFHLPISKNSVPHDFTTLYLLLGNDPAQLLHIRPLHIVPDYIYLAVGWYLSRNSKEDIHWFMNITWKKHWKNALFERRVQPISLYMAYVVLNHKLLRT